jgi:hypothetical protein
MSPVRFDIPTFLALAALAAASAGPVAAAEPVPCEWSGVARVVVVGDVHGDADQLVRALRAAKVIDASGDWAAGAAHLVQLGDVFDRGPDSRKAMDLLMRLEGQAAKAGGRVHALIGNHEAMVLAGRLFYMSPDELATYGGPEGLQKAMEPDGTYGRWIRGHNTIIRIDDTLFVHGGLSPAYARRPLREINDAVRRELGTDADEGVTGASGPLWYRGLACGLDDELETLLKPVLETHRAARIVVGHTVTKGGIVVRAGGRLVMADVGMSQVYGGPAACLVIEGTRLTEVRPEGTREVPVSSPAPAVPAGKPTGARPAARRAAGRPPASAGGSPVPTGPGPCRRLTSPTRHSTRTA